jgi:hypothetical protein
MTWDQLFLIVVVCWAIDGAFDRGVREGQRRGSR